MQIKRISDFRTGQIRKVIATATFALSLNGCALVRDQAQVDPIVASETSWGGHGQPSPVIPDCLISDWVKRASEESPSETPCVRSISAGPKHTPITSPDTITLPRLSGNPLTRRIQAQAELMTYADQVCDDHIAGIYAKNASFNLGFGLLTTLFSGGAAIATGRAATNLAAESALFSGSRSMINSEVYYGYIGPAVMREILSMRSDLRTQIAGKRNCSLNDYPPQEAIDDALTYHNACSFSTGLASLLSKAGTTRVGEDKLREAQLGATAAQLASKKTELTAFETQQAALAPGDAKQAKLKEKIASLQKEIAGLEAVQRFAGVVDPLAAAPAQSGLRQQLDDARALVQLSEQTLKEKTAANASAADLTKAQAAFNNAKSAFSDLNGRIAEANLAALKVQQAERDLDAIVAKKQTLRDQWKTASENERTNLDKQMAAQDALLATAQQALIDAQKNQREKGPALAADGGIPFGIQSCSPLVLPTMH